MENEMKHGMVQTLSAVIDAFEEMIDTAKEAGQNGINPELELDVARTIASILSIERARVSNLCVPAEEAKNTAFDHTIDMMRSPDYKERFKAEYLQTKIRYEKLKKFNTKIEAANSMMCYKPDALEEPKHDCPFDLLRRQQSIMGEYLHLLEVRAEIEHIEL